MNRIVHLHALMFSLALLYSQTGYSQAPKKDDDLDYGDLSLGDEEIRDNYTPGRIVEPTPTTGSDFPDDMDPEAGLDLSGPSSSPFSLTKDPTRKRDLFWPAFASLLLPGFDQWWEGQTPYNYLYSGVALGSLGVAVALLPEPQGDDESDYDFEYRLSYGNRERGFQLAAQTVSAMGSFSAYHSFRSAVRSRQAYGEFTFLQHEESMVDILTSPFDFKYISRPSTYIPLTIITAFSAVLYGAVYASEDEPDSEVGVRALGAEDVLFAGGFSLNAGTHEEAMFRGWLMPLMRQKFNSDVGSNALQSLLFAAAHYPTNPRPIIQLLLGYHLGNVVQNDQWRLGEAAFIHFWWDVVAFISTYSIYKFEPAQIGRPLPVLWLPSLQLAF